MLETCLQDFWVQFQSTITRFNIFSITLRPHLICGITSRPHLICSITLSPHLICSITLSPHLICNITLSPHLICSITSRPHLICSITSRPHLICSIASPSLNEHATSAHTTCWFSRIVLSHDLLFEMLRNRGHLVLVSHTGHGWGGGYGGGVRLAGNAGVTALVDDERERFGDVEML